jgi:hypothetical protein
MLVVVLTACGGIAAAKPSKQIVEQAIVQQLSQTQTELNQLLRLDSDPAGITVRRIQITAQTPLVIQDLPAVRVQGTYDYTTKLTKRQVTLVQNPFDLYLQRQQEGKTWRLAKRVIDKTGEATWVTQRVKQF